MKLKKLLTGMMTLAAACVFATSAFAAGFAPDLTTVEAGDATLHVGDSYYILCHPKSDGSINNMVDFNHPASILKHVATDQFREDGNSADTVRYTFEATSEGEGIMRVYGYNGAMDPNNILKYTIKVVADDVPLPGDAGETTDTPETPAAPEAAKPAASAAQAAPAADSHSEIGEAIASGTWGAEYTVCEACGQHNWTACEGGYRCDNCGSVTSSVKTSANVKGFTAPASAAAPAAPVYASAAEAQAAANQREAAYAASVAAYQKSIAAREAAYLRSLGL